MSNGHVLINRPTFNERTAFITAAFHGHIEICKTLLDNVENINHQDKDGKTALMYAAQEGRYILAQWLVSKGSNTSLRSTDNENALDLAIKFSQVSVVKFLRGCTETDTRKKNQRRMSTPTGLPIIPVKNNNLRRMSVHPSLNAAQKKNNNNQRRMSIL